MEMKEPAKRIVCVPSNKAENRSSSSSLIFSFALGVFTPNGFMLVDNLKILRKYMHRKKNQSNPEGKSINLNLDEKLDKLNFIQVPSTR